jgi:hypothetical protein
VARASNVEAVAGRARRICDTAVMAQRPPQTPSAGEPPHDVLAAEEFAVPAPDPDLHHHEPVVLPDDPTGIPEPHDVLAAEEFPIPAVPHKPPSRRRRR